LQSIMPAPVILLSLATSAALMFDINILELNY